MDSIEAFELPTLPEGFTAEFGTREVLESEYKRLLPIIFHRPSRLGSINVPEERKAPRELLYARFFSRDLNLIILVRDQAGQVVGWITGEQHDWETFYLRNSGFIPEVRRKGIYSLVHERLVEHLRKIGFERVVSDHQPHNRAILMLKLKAGYNIQSMTLDDRFGSLVRVVLFLNPERQTRFEDRFDLIPLE
jgi:GNAT superfamily N-acetyltransferase